jgi:adenosylcobinamide-GDP ribazoletransferase
MAPNRRGGPLTRSSSGNTPTKRTKATPKASETSSAVHDNDLSVISKKEIEDRGAGTDEDTDTYVDLPFLRGEKRVFFTAVIFLTRLNVPRWAEADHHPAYLMRSMMHFPFLGLCVGIWAAVWLEAAAVLWTPFVAAAASTLAGVWITGAFHEDGLADSLDAFGGGWGRLQILRIMTDTRVGTYALVGMILVMGMKLKSLEVLQSLSQSDITTSTFLPSLSLSPASVALLVAHTVSRWTVLPLIYSCHYIQDEQSAKRGLYNWFADSQRLLTLPRLCLGTLVTILVPVLLLPVEQAMSVFLVVVLVTLGASYYGNLIIGGVIGDYLGATIQVCELCVYLLLSADLKQAQTNPFPLVMLAGTAVLPILTSRPLIDFGFRAEC